MCVCVYKCVAVCVGGVRVCKCLLSTKSPVKKPFETGGSLKDSCASSVAPCSQHTGQLEQRIIVVPPLTQQPKNT